MRNRIQELRRRGDSARRIWRKRWEFTRQTIISLENGKYNASLVLAHKLARYSSCTIEDIFLFDEEE